MDLFRFGMVLNVAVLLVGIGVLAFLVSERAWLAVLPVTIGVVCGGVAFGAAVLVLWNGKVTPNDR